LKTARDRMDMIATYNDVGSYRGAAAVCGVDPKTVKKAVLGRATIDAPERAGRKDNFDVVAGLVGGKDLGPHIGQSPPA
jgi:hypothetical protein